MSLFLKSAKPSVSTTDWILETHLLNVKRIKKPFDIISGLT